MEPSTLLETYDSYVTESGRRRVVFGRRAHSHKPFVVQVFIQQSAGSNGKIISESEYYTKEVALQAFEFRRPNMHVEEGEVPMQRGKRLVQEMLQEKLK